MTKRKEQAAAKSMTLVVGQELLVSRQTETGFVAPELWIITKITRTKIELTTSDGDTVRIFRFYQ
jgi:hypothetical protein